VVSTSSAGSLVGSLASSSAGSLDRSTPYILEWRGCCEVLRFLVLAMSNDDGQQEKNESASKNLEALLCWPRR
jgi:hypothetical protein